jgi:hypothetical protein
MVTSSSQGVRPQRGDAGLLLGVNIDHDHLLISDSIGAEFSVPNSFRTDWGVLVTLLQHWRDCDHHRLELVGE